MKVIWKGCRSRIMKSETSADSLRKVFLCDSGPFGLPYFVYIVFRIMPRHDLSHILLNSFASFTTELQNKHKQEKWPSH